MRSIFVLFICGGFLYAAPPKVQESYEVKPGQILRIVVPSKDPIGIAKNFKDEDVFFDELVPKDGERRFLFQSLTEGKYTIAFWTKGEVEGVCCTVTVGNGETPPPNPQPQPKPSSGKRKIVIIEERQNRTLEIAERLLAVSDWREQDDILSVTIYDKDSPDAKKHLTHIKENYSWKVPVVLVYDEKDALQDVKTLTDFTPNASVTKWQPNRPAYPIPLSPFAPGFYCPT